MPGFSKWAGSKAHLSRCWWFMSTSVNITGPTVLTVYDPTPDDFPGDITQDVDFDGDGYATNLSLTPEDEELLEQAPDIAQLGEAGAKILPRFREFQHDGFSALFKGAPRVKRVEEISDQVTAHNKILEAMQGMEEWKTLRASTVRDRLASLVSIRELNDLVSKLPDGVKRAVHQQQNEERTAEELAARLEALRRMWKRTDDPNEKKEIEQEGDMGRDVF